MVSRGKIKPSKLLNKHQKLVMHKARRYGFITQSKKEGPLPKTDAAVVNYHDLQLTTEE